MALIRKKSILSKIIIVVLIIIVLFAIATVVVTLALPSVPYEEKQFSNQTKEQTVESIERGHMVAIAGNCIACHQTSGSNDQTLGGGFAMETPFGDILASNITPDIDTGLGSWTEKQFADAMRQGKGSHGYLYPAMPYTSYVLLTDQDIHDLWSYIKSIEPKNNLVIENQFSFPFSFRPILLGWNVLFFESKAFVSDPSQTEQWNRGAYLVRGATHCSMCHTPRNILGGEKGSQDYFGAQLDGWYAGNITNDVNYGIGSWTQEDVVAYLKTGSNRFTAASSSMAAVVENSLQYMPDDDLNAIAVYLKSIPTSGLEKAPQIPQTDRQMVAGKRLYSANCMACHVSNGSGIDSMIPALAGNTAIQAPVTDSLLYIILQGSRAAVTDHNPTGAAMPSFSWKLNDQEIADVLTYIRNDWGNSGTAILPSQVKKTRQTLESQKLVVKSTDQP